jgi:RNA polymerase sigma-70 factor (ECF subfamily)
MVTSESEIARGLIAGQPEAFDKFVEVYRTKVFQYSYSMCGHREDAEEVAQETLMSVFQHLGQIREPEHLKSWVFRIAKNACLMKRRKSVFAPSVEEPLDDIEPPDHEPAPDRVVLETEQKHLLCGAILQLPEIYRSVVLLRDVEELSTEETADILGVSVDVVKTRLKRARRQLRDGLHRARPGDWHVEGPAPLDVTCKRRLMDAYNASVPRLDQSAP